MIDISYKLFFSAFSNKTRFEIIKLLRNGNPKNVSELCKELSFEQSRVSHNLRCLIDCGFVEVKQDGKNRVYSLNKETVYPMIGLMDKHIKKYQKHLVKCGVLE